MGDRANILVKENSEDKGVYLYSHWNGSELPFSLKLALERKQRWNDPAYLTRIIFDTMTAGQQGEETGYGISTYTPDGDDRILEVNCGSQTVTVKVAGKPSRTCSFGDYIEIKNPTWSR